MLELAKKISPNALKALQICLTLPAFSWVGVFLGGTYLSFLGSISCIVMIYLIWVYILGMPISKIFLTQEKKIYWAPIILRIIPSLGFDWIGIAFIVPIFMKLAIVPLGYEWEWVKVQNESESGTLFWPALQFMKSYSGSFYATFVMGLYISLQYFIIAYSLSIINKLKPLEK